jgi:hypothetical protein
MSQAKKNEQLYCSTRDVLNQGSFTTVVSSIASSLAMSLVLDKMNHEVAESTENLYSTKDLNSDD